MRWSVGQKRELSLQSWVSVANTASADLHLLLSRKPWPFCHNSCHLFHLSPQILHILVHFQRQCLTNHEKRCLSCVGHAVAWCRGAGSSSRWPGMLGHKWAVGPARPQRRPEPGHWGLGIEKPRSGETKNPNKEQPIPRHRIYPDWNEKKGLSWETGKVESSIEKLKIEKKKNWFSTNLRSEPQKWGQVKEEVVEATRTLRRSSRRRSARRWPTWRSSWYSRWVTSWKCFLNREFYHEAGGGVIRNVK